MSDTGQDEDAPPRGPSVEEEAQGSNHPPRRRHSAYASSQLLQSTMAEATATEHPLSHITRSRARSSPHYRLGSRLGLSDHSSDVSALSVEIAVAEASEHRYSPVARQGNQDLRHGRSRSMSVSGHMGTSSRSSSVRGSMATPRKERSRRSATQVKPHWSDSDEAEDDGEKEEPEEMEEEGQEVIRRHRPQRSVPSVLDLFNLAPVNRKPAASSGDRCKTCFPAEGTDGLARPRERRSSSSSRVEHPQRRHSHHRRHHSHHHHNRQPDSKHTDSSDGLRSRADSCGAVDPAAPPLSRRNSVFLPPPLPLLLPSVTHEGEEGEEEGGKGITAPKQEKKVICVQQRRSALPHAKQRLALPRIVAHRHTTGQGAQTQTTRRGTVGGTVGRYPRPVS